MKRRIFLDSEWTGPPWSNRSELMWIGLADEEGGPGLASRSRRRDQSIYQRFHF